jgi:hypothetical protein
MCHEFQRWCPARFRRKAATIDSDSASAAQYAGYDCVSARFFEIRAEAANAVAVGAVQHPQSLSSRLSTRKPKKRRRHPSHFG